MLKKSLTLKNATLIQPRKDTRPQECHLVPIKLQIHNSTGKSPVIYWLSAIKIQVSDVSGLRLISWMQSSGTLWKDRSMSTTAPDFLRAARILRNVTRHGIKTFLVPRDQSRPSYYGELKKKTASYGCSLRESLARDRIRVPKGWVLLLKATQNE